MTRHVSFIIILINQIVSLITLNLLRKTISRCDRKNLTPTQEDIEHLQIVNTAYTKVSTEEVTKQMQEQTRTNRASERTGEASKASKANKHEDMKQESSKPNKDRQTQQ